MTGTVDFSAKAETIEHMLVELDMSKEDLVDVIEWVLGIKTNVEKTPDGIEIQPTESSAPPERLTKLLKRQAPEKLAELLNAIEHLIEKRIAKVKYEQSQISAELDSMLELEGLSIEQIEREMLAAEHHSRKKNANTSGGIFSKMRQAFSALLSGNKKQKTVNINPALRHNINDSQSVTQKIIKDVEMVEEYHIAQDKQEIKTKKRDFKKKDGSNNTNQARKIAEEEAELDLIRDAIFDEGVGENESLELLKSKEQSKEEIKKVEQVEEYHIAQDKYNPEKRKEKEAKKKNRTPIIRKKGDATMSSLRKSQVDGEFNQKDDGETESSREKLLDLQTDLDQPDIDLEFDLERDQKNKEALNEAKKMELIEESSIIIQKQKAAQQQIGGDDATEEGEGIGRRRRQIDNSDEMGFDADEGKTSDLKETIQNDIKFVKQETKKTIQNVELITEAIEKTQKTEAKQKPGRNAMQPKGAKIGVQKLAMLEEKLNILNNRASGNQARTNAIEQQHNQITQAQNDIRGGINQQNAMNQSRDALAQNMNQDKNFQLGDKIEVGKTPGQDAIERQKETERLL